MRTQVLSDQASAALEAWVRLLRAHAATTRELSVLLVAEHELTINDYGTLLLLARAEGNRLRRIDLADELVLTPSGVTRMLDGLERAGLVEKAKCSTDGRVTYAVLTDSGREKLEQASPSHLAAIHALFEERFTAAELRTLGELLARLPGAAAGYEGECEA
jgi:DNA-binding MarR family transcriptional regulator